MDNLKNSNDALNNDYNENFMPAVHRWGRTSMVIALFLSFLPIAYMYFILGWRASIDAYISVFIAIGSFGIGMWLTEPLSYYPILGSAGTYMSYLAGNVGNMRNPVAMSVQSLFDTDVNNPKGQIITICAVAISIFVNLIVLIIIVMSGSWLVSVMPKFILESLSYVLPSLFGCMLAMRTNKKVKDSTIYLCFAVTVYFICAKFPQVRTFGMAISVGTTVLGAYIIHKFKTKSIQ